MASIKNLLPHKKDIININKNEYLKHKIDDYDNFGMFKEITSNYGWYRNNDFLLDEIENSNLIIYWPFMEWVIDTSLIDNDYNNYIKDYKSKINKLITLDEVITNNQYDKIHTEIMFSIFSEKDKIGEKNKTALWALSYLSFMDIEYDDSIFIPNEVKPRIDGGIVQALVFSHHLIENNTDSDEKWINIAYKKLYDCLTSSN